MLTREERRVLAFVITGIVLGSWPLREAAVGSAPPDASDAPAVVEADLFPIDLNRAGPELLAELPGIGPAKAQAIVDLRERRGAFGSVDELEEVRGIWYPWTSHTGDLWGAWSGSSYHHVCLGKSRLRVQG